MHTLTLWQQLKAGKVRARQLMELSSYHGGNPLAESDCRLTSHWSRGPNKWARDILVALSPNAKPQNLIWASDHSLAVNVIIYARPITGSYSRQLLTSCCFRNMKSRGCQLASSTSVKRSIIVMVGNRWKLVIKETSICKTIVLTVHLGMLSFFSLVLLFCSGFKIMYIVFPYTVV